MAHITEAPWTVKVRMEAYCDRGQAGRPARKPGGSERKHAMLIRNRIMLASVVLSLLFTTAQPGSANPPAMSGTGYGNVGPQFPPPAQEFRDDGPLGATEPRFSLPLRPELLRRGPYQSVQVNVDAFGWNIIDDAANEPTIAVDPTDHNRIVIGWRQFDTITSNFRQAGWAYSHDTGRSWTFPGVLEEDVSAATRSWRPTPTATSTTTA